MPFFKISSFMFHRRKSNWFGTWQWKNFWVHRQSLNLPFQSTFFLRIQVKLGFGDMPTTPEPRHNHKGWQAHQWNIWQPSASLFIYKATPSEKLQRQRARNIILGMCGKNREDRQKLPVLWEQEEFGRLSFWNHF